jgi:hypothetical protein
LREVVTSWINDSFQSKSLSQGLIGNQTTFQTVALSPKEAYRARRSRRHLQEDPVLLSAIFTGVSLWERRGQGTSPIDPELVELIQRATFLEDNRLLTSLQAASPASGLGFYVVNARANINPLGYDNPNSNLQGSTTDDSNDNLEIIIIIAIIVACLAFALLMFAVLWAWTADRQKQQAYAVDAPKVMRSPDTGTGSTSDHDYEQNQPPKLSSSSPNHGEDQRLPPSMIQPQEYPESVISEDIDQSLTSYYKSGMAGYNLPRRELNDAASMSSMDSYGYSLDGYAPSLSGGPTQMGYPVGPMNGQIKNPSGFDTDADNDTGFDTDAEYQEYPQDTDAEEEAPVSTQEDPIGEKI